jgi:hypothetical protein
MVPQAYNLDIHHLSAFKRQSSKIMSCIFASTSCFIASNHGSRLKPAWKQYNSRDIHIHFRYTSTQCWHTWTWWYDDYGSTHIYHSNYYFQI